MSEDGASATVGEGAARTPVRRGKNVRGLRTRQELLDAALSCFSEYGYSRTRISDIVFRAGVSQGNFYRHFQSKTEIFLEALRPSLDELTASTGRGCRRRRCRPRDDDGPDQGLLHLVHPQPAHPARHARGGRDQRRRRFRRPVAAAARRVRRAHRPLAAPPAPAGRIEETDFELLADVLGSTIEQTAYVHIGLPAEAPRPERIQQLALMVATVWHRSLPIAQSPAQSAAQD
ncbi:TetR/AcrR family transcriptional regulator [Pseudonocardia sp. ICBG601]|uniref:TetR/AcrR family transcriptional regulator n=1 Tax=Pseudonocardia sp. ICBG601 TaxID=2846759 RepID=UPI001CF61885|nr:helix-turn-helix domain-containing protein [Pseudonocardia sp. ICBG601]